MGKKLKREMKKAAFCYSSNDDVMLSSLKPTIKKQLREKKEICHFFHQ